MLVSLQRPYLYAVCPDNLGLISITSYHLPWPCTFCGISDVFILSLASGLFSSEEKATDQREADTGSE